jgi:hypothetical protein
LDDLNALMGMWRVKNNSRAIFSNTNTLQYYTNTIRYRFDTDAYVLSFILIHNDVKITTIISIFNCNGNPKIINKTWSIRQDCFFFSGYVSGCFGVILMKRFWMIDNWIIFMFIGRILSMIEMMKWIL